MKTKHYSIAAATLIATVCLTSLPAFAVNARQAMKACDQRPGCDYKVDGDGWVDIHVGGKAIICPPGDNSSCIVATRTASMSDFRVHATSATVDDGSGHHSSGGGSHGGGGNGGSSGGGHKVAGVGQNGIGGLQNSINPGGSDGRQAIH